MTRKEEIREAAITTIELLKGFTPEQREKWDNATHSVEELANCILELTAPESSPIWYDMEKVEKPDYSPEPKISSPAPLESQEELWETVGRRFQNIITIAGFYDVVSEYKSKFILTRRTEVSCDSCDHKSCGYPNSDCRDSWKLENKVSPDLDKFHDLENGYKVTE